MTPSSGSGPVVTAAPVGATVACSRRRCPSVATVERSGDLPIGWLLLIGAGRLDHFCAPACVAAACDELTGDRSSDSSATWARDTDEESAAWFAAALADWVHLQPDRLWWPEDTDTVVHLQEWFKEELEQEEREWSYIPPPHDGADSDFLHETAAEEYYQAQSYDADDDDHSNNYYSPIDDQDVWDDIGDSATPATVRARDERWNNDISDDEDDNDRSWPEESWFEDAGHAAWLLAIEFTPPWTPTGRRGDRPKGERHETATQGDELALDRWLP